MKHSYGFGIIEIIVAVAIFITIGVSAVTTVIGSFSSNRLADEQTEATVFAEQGLEAAKSIRNIGWTTPFLATNCTTGCGIGTSGTAWAWSGTNNVSGKFTRVIEVLPVQRDLTGDIVESGGINDPDTRKITSTVTWNYTAGNSNTVLLEAYVTNFTMSWTTPVQNFNYNASGTSDGYSIATQGNSMYMVRSGGSPDFLIFDISDPGNPVLSSATTIGNTPSGIYVAGNYAYVSGFNTSQELRILNIQNPEAPFVVGTYNAPGSADTNDIFVSGTTAYLFRAASTDPEFMVLNVSNPASITVLGSLQLTGEAIAGSRSGNYVAIASTNNSQELQLVNITNPASPSLAGTYNASGNNDGWAIAYFGTTVVLGRAGGNVHIISTSSPGSPSLVSTYAAGGNVMGMWMGVNNSYVYLATENTTSDFQILNISTPGSPSLVRSFNTQQTLADVAFNSTYAIAGFATTTDAAEFITIRPN